MESFSIQTLINDKLRKQEEQRQPKIQTTWHSSSLGSCLCGTYLARLGAKPDQPFDDRTLRVFTMGKKIEDWIIEIIKEQPDYESETQGRILDEQLHLSGYYDLRIKNKQTNKEFLYEIKSKHSRSFWYMDKQKQGAQDSHKMQLWSYLYVTGIEEGRIIYVSKDDLAVLEYPVFRNDKQLEEQVLNQLEILNKAWELKLPPLPAPEGSWQAEYCGFHKQCLQQKQKEYYNIEPLFYQKVKKEKVDNKKSITI